MKALALAIAFFLSPVSFADSGSGLFVSDNVMIGNFIALLSNDCKTIYFLPTTFGVDRSRSSVLSTSANEVQVSVLLKPAIEVPSLTEKKAMASWAMEDIGHCSEGNFNFKPYPNNYLRLTPTLPIEAEGITGLRAEYQGRGNTAIVFNVDLKTSSFADVLQSLANLKLEGEMQTFELKTLASAELSIDFKAAANFAVRHYVERSCTLTKSRNIVGREDAKENCEDIHKYVQYFQDGSIDEGARLVTGLSYGEPPELMEKLQDQIISRLMMSLFLTTTKMKIDNVTTVTLGELQKNISGTYHDFVSTVRLEQTQYNGPLDAPSFSELLIQDLKPLYSRKQLKETL
jgi:hypothetical protein